ncbi:putative uncharacterized protein DDB_G0282133 [Gordionus sp. m RMFG-2023]|uniref:putative uncharacterized protein DDB_G0282133 n=1 Tax=Gordionus sp. m RMFG-2023 TaxID=3053472 RepID=UPI0031FDD56D
MNISLRKTLLEKKGVSFHLSQATLIEYLSEHYYLENNNNILDYVSWKKKFPSDLQNYTDNFFKQTQFDIISTHKISTIQNKFDKESYSQSLNTSCKIEWQDETDNQLQPLNIKNNFDLKNENFSYALENQSFANHQNQEEILDLNERVLRLKQKGLWSSSLLPKIAEIHFDHSTQNSLNKEMCWMHHDFEQEKIWKKLLLDKISKQLISLFPSYSLFQSFTCNKYSFYHCQNIAMIINNFWKEIKSLLLQMGDVNSVKLKPIHNYCIHYANTYLNDTKKLKEINKYSEIINELPLTISRDDPELRKSITSINSIEDFQTYPTEADDSFEDTYSLQTFSAEQIISHLIMSDKINFNAKANIDLKTPLEILDAFLEDEIENRTRINDTLLIHSNYFDSPPCSLFFDSEKEMEYLDNLPSLQIVKLDNAYADNYYNRNNYSAVMANNSPLISNTSLTPISMLSANLSNQSSSLGASPKINVFSYQTLVPYFSPVASHNKMTKNALKFHNNQVERETFNSSNTISGSSSALNSQVTPVSGNASANSFNSSASSNNWLIHESWSLINGIKYLQGFSLNIIISTPAHSPNWDFSSEFVNSVSCNYKSAKECRTHYENVVLVRERSFQMSNSSGSNSNMSDFTGSSQLSQSVKRQKVSKQHHANKQESNTINTYKAFTQDKYNSYRRYITEKFDNVLKHKIPSHQLFPNKVESSKSADANGFQFTNANSSNNLWMHTLYNYGINYNVPLDPLTLIKAKMDRINREKKHLQIQNKSIISELSMIPPAQQKGNKFNLHQSASVDCGVTTVDNHAPYPENKYIYKILSNNNNNTCSSLNSFSTDTITPNDINFSNINKARDYLFVQQGHNIVSHSPQDSASNNENSNLKSLSNFGSLDNSLLLSQHTKTTPLSLFNRLQSDPTSNPLSYPITTGIGPKRRNNVNNRAKQNPNNNIRPSSQARLPSNIPSPYYLQSSFPSANDEITLLDSGLNTQKYFTTLDPGEEANKLDGNPLSSLPSSISSLYQRNAPFKSGSINFLSQDELAKIAIGDLQGTNIVNATKSGNSSMRGGGLQSTILQSHQMNQLSNKTKLVTCPNTSYPSNNNTNLNINLNNNVLSINQQAAIKNSLGFFNLIQINNNNTNVSNSCVNQNYTDNVSSYVVNNTNFTTNNANQTSTNFTINSPQQPHPNNIILLGGDLNPSFNTHFPNQKIYITLKSMPSIISNTDLASNINIIPKCFSQNITETL